MSEIDGIVYAYFFVLLVVWLGLAVCAALLRKRIMRCFRSFGQMVKSSSEYRSGKMDNFSLKYRK